MAPTLWSNTSLDIEIINFKVNFRKRCFTLLVGAILINMLLHTIGMVHHSTFLTKYYLFLIYLLKLRPKLNIISK